MKILKSIIKNEVMNLQDQNECMKLLMFNEEYLELGLSELDEMLKKIEKEILEKVLYQQYDKDIYFVPLRKEEALGFTNIFFKIEIENYIDHFDHFIEIGILFLEDGELSEIEHEIFNGILMYKETVYDIQFKFKKICIAEKLERELHDILLKNNIKWKILNLAYLHKYYGIEAIGLPEELEIHVYETQNFKYNLENYKNV